MAACRRTADGATKTKTDKSGAAVYIHRLDGARLANGNGYIHPGHLRPPATNGAANKPPATSVDEAAAAVAADADTLHRAYSYIIDHLTLSAQHRAALRKRGLPDDAIDRRGYRSYPFEGRDRLALRLMMLLQADKSYLHVPGFIRTGHGPTLAGPEGLLVPCRNADRRIEALKVRRDDVSKGAPKYVYVSSAKHGGPGPGAPAHVPIGMNAPADVVRLTEGELKADVATVLSGVPTIGAPSATGWRACLPALRTLGTKTVRLAFDDDARTNKTVAAAQVACVEALRGEGFAVELERWPEAAGKGIDDALAAGTETEVLTGDAAVAAAREIAAAAGVGKPAGPATATIAVEGVGAVCLSVGAAGAKPQRIVSAKIGDVRHDDRLDVLAATRRKQFARRLAEKLNAPASFDALNTALDAALVELADAADKNAKDGKSGDGGDAPQSQATTIVELAAEWQLWHTPGGDAYATITVGEHQEHWPIRSQSFRRFAAKALYDATGTAANSESLSAALNLLEAQAAHEGDEHPVGVRLTEHQGAVYLDLCDAEWRAIEITADGWRIVDEPPVRFRRVKGTLALPVPERGGSLDALRRLANIDDADWPLVVAWLVAALRPRGPYPVLALFATQGAGKSNAAKFLRGLIDPNAAPLRAEPREVRDLMISANGNWCIAYDNLSHLPPWLSDALCRLSTGGGFATRELYSDADEVIFDAVRPVILTSIVELAERSDLLERCLPVSLPPIVEDRRRDEATLDAEYQAARPKILGALLDAVAGALAELPRVKLDKLPRMADFTKWATAAEPALGWSPGTVVEAYTRSRAAANELALEASPIAGRLMELLGERGEWQGTAAELLDALDKKFGMDAKRPSGWPKNARGMAAHLRRLAPNLSAAGWGVVFERRAGGGRARTITITKAARESGEI